MQFTQRTLSVGAFQCNCQILVCPQTFEAAIVDPGDEPEKILKEIAALETKLNAKIKIKALLHTHAHLDHIGGTRKVKEHFANLNAGGEIPQIFLHRGDAEIYQMLPQQGKMFGMQYDVPLPVDQFFEDEQTLKIGSLHFTVIHTPGHSPGGVCFRMHADSALAVPETVFTGDTLFRESIGRTDLWGADSDQLLTSIRQRLFVLDDDTKAWPGHGFATSIGHEKRKNPFLT